MSIPPTQPAYIFIRSMELPFLIRTGLSGMTFESSLKGLFERTPGPERRKRDGHRRSRNNHAASGIRHGHIAGLLLRCAGIRGTQLVCSSAQLRLGLAQAE